jgi:sulfur-carrier protein adenylyltransferase/sulfurtransferase
MNLGTEKTEITALELKKRLDAKERLLLLDVREPHELEICKLDNAIHIPMGELATRVSELADHKTENIVVYCRSGGRSGNCANFLRQNGFQSVLNLEGGTLGWSADVDPSMPKY